MGSEKKLNQSYPMSQKFQPSTASVAGQAIYEMFLLEPQFSRVFLNRLLGRINEAWMATSGDCAAHSSLSSH